MMQPRIAKLARYGSVVWLLALLAGCKPKSGQDLSAMQLTAVVAREQGSLTPCYQHALDQKPYSHEFRIEVTLRIRPDGTVSEVSLDQSGIEGVGSCIEATIRGWKFPTANDETHARLPIIFSPKIEKVMPNLPPGFKVLQDK